MSFPYDAVVWSAVCEYDITWSCPLNISSWLKDKSLMYMFIPSLSSANARAYLAFMGYVSCADPANFVREGPGPTPTMFFFFFFFFFFFGGGDDEGGYNPNTTISWPQSLVCR